MTQSEFFWRGLMTLVMVTGGIREMRRDNTGLGVVMVGIPALAWLSLLWPVSR